MYGHKGCIESKGKSVAVLPYGLDKIYPSPNRASVIMQERFF